MPASNQPDTPDQWWTASRRRVLLAAYWLAMFVGTHWPGALQVMQQDQTDKLLHFTAFAGLAWLVAWTTDASQRPLFLRVATIVGTLAIYAAVDEWLQMYVGRVCDPLDWLADMVGTAAGLGWYVWRRKIERQPMREA